MGIHMVLCNSGILQITEECGEDKLLKDEIVSIQLNPILSSYLEIRYNSRGKAHTLVLQDALLNIRSYRVFNDLLKWEKMNFIYEYALISSGDKPNEATKAVIDKIEETKEKVELEFQKVRWLYFKRYNLMIKNISILGYRGYSTQQTVFFSIPDNLPGSGITFIVGANNSGKTTILESIKAFSSNDTPTFSVGKRNTQADSRINLTLVTSDNITHTITTIFTGGSSTLREPNQSIDIYSLQSRRYLSYEFDKSSWNRSTFTQNYSLGNRNYQLNGFQYRLFNMQEHKEEFDKILYRILPHNFEWTIDQSDSGQYFVKFTYNGLSHNSEGIGDGIWSLFTICDALYDSSPESTIIIDEPELSLHPAYQRKLMKIFEEYSKDRQIIISTHSPYFINWNCIANGASLLRATKLSSNEIQVFNLSDENKCHIKGLIKDLNNPHVLGLNANEAFFLENKIILVEGQEDVVILNRLLDEKTLDLDGEFFGWGVGGAPKMEIFLSIFKNLGYTKICAILDGDKKEDYLALKEKYPEYHFIILPEDDIRDKKNRTISAKRGITTEKGKLKANHETFFNSMINEINSYMHL